MEHTIASVLGGAIGYGFLSFVACAVFGGFWLTVTAMAELSEAKNVFDVVVQCFSIPFYFLPLAAITPVVVIFTRNPAWSQLHAVPWIVTGVVLVVRLTLWAFNALKSKI